MAAETVPGSSPRLPVTGLSATGSTAPGLSENGLSENGLSENGLSESGLLGTWVLESYVDLGADGRTAPGPLGDRPRGLLIYGADRHMSVSMMRPADPRGQDLAGATVFMGYAGTWRLAGGEVVHEVAVASHPYLVGRSQVRTVSLADGVLVLSGVAPPEAARPGRRVLTWRRAGPRQWEVNRAEP